MILEGIVTTLNADGTVNIAPMGPQVDLERRQIVLRPFQTSTTFQNLNRSGQGVFHVTDDVELLARAAIGRVDPLPELMAAEGVEGFRLADTCRWHAFRVRHGDDQSPRATFVADVVATGHVRDFFGFNRAKHAVVEAAILATRTHLLSSEEIAGEFAKLKILIDKTGGPQEHRAFALLGDYVAAAGKRGGNG
ncbi:MAG: hypothetical protein B7Z73_14255 [Planctomycetia bacterium 21-64-5]|nr:MAG: hypothetical protein B7Z73_14255 [Planctomycetia bacterium 21-64-5]